jgi:hypothetical protein
LIDKSNNNSFSTINYSRHFGGLFPPKYVRSLTERVCQSFAKRTYVVFVSDEVYPPFGRHSGSRKIAGLAMYQYRGKGLKLVQGWLAAPEVEVSSNVAVEGTMDEA